MSSYNVHDAKSNFSKLLDQVLEGEHVLITRNGVPVAELVPARRGGLVLGSGANDPNCNPNAPDDWWQPMSDEEVQAFFEGR